VFVRNDYISHGSRLSNFYNYLNIWMTCNWYVAFDHFGGVVVSVLTSIVVDHGFEIRFMLLNIKYIYTCVNHFSLFFLYKRMTTKNYIFLSLGIPMANSPYFSSNSQKLLIKLTNSSIVSI
jgi:hypothetical protein